MRFEWDENKNQTNIRKRGIDFSDAADIFKHPMLTLFDGREDYGEDRWIALGWIHSVIGVVVYVERGRCYPHYLCP
ncbi:BrnT family toxin [Undibacterium sp. JH2W]|uniref:BrnT family toxin n=1 Tax=Undibacterium sp. JH2W TaxID=3413037 RepID=UPI003BEFB86A